MANVHRLFDKKDDEEDEGKQSFYTGGADNRGGGGSGMAVYGPPKDDEEGDVFDRLVNRAQRDSAAGAGTDASSEGMGDQSGRKKKEITLYSNGFTVDNGPLREPDTPENQKFLEELLRGSVPSELRSEMRGNVLDVGLADRRSETYVPPAYVAFSGGSTLGSSQEISSDAVFSDDGTEVPALNDAEPTTTVQVKTADGKKLRLKLNTSISVRQLAAAIRAQQAGACPATFTTMCAFLEFI